MVGILCLCFVSARGELTGSPRVGVSKVERRGRGALFLDAKPPPDGATVRISALPLGYVARWSADPSGIQIEVFDQQGRPTDHGFAFVIEAPVPNRPAGNAQGPGSPPTG